MKKVLFLIAFTFSCLFAKAGVTIPYTESPYNVNYPWGIIDVMIAHGFVKIQSDGEKFHGTLDGTSIPWEGHIILVSDTLNFNILPGNGISKEKVAYQSGWYRHPKVSYFHSSGYNSADPAIYKNIAGGGEYNASKSSMEAITVTSDMLGMFYYAKEINFAGMQPGQHVVIPIDGKYAQEVVVTYEGNGTYTAEGKTYNTYNCRFEYTYGGQLSGYQVEMKIGQDNRLPLYISASLPVGRVEMLYAG